MTTDFDQVLEFDGLRDPITLEEEQFSEAQHLSQQTSHPERQWSLYKQALALLAFEDWIVYRAPKLSVHKEKSTVYQPDPAQHLDAVTQLQVGEFKVCLLPNLCLADAHWVLPSVVLDRPDLVAHLYVLIGIDEESALAAVQGFLRFDQLQTLTTELTPDTAGNYALPLLVCNSNANDLLLNLECLDPATIPLPTPATNATPALSKLNQGVMDVRKWLKSQAEVLSEELGWTPLPPLTPAFRDESPVGSLLADIQKRENLTIPTETRQAFTDIRPQSIVPATTSDAHSETAMQLHGITWSLDAAHWSLLLILMAAPELALPVGTTLQVNDLTQVLWQKQLQPPHDYLYVHLTAAYDEVLTATVTSTDGIVSSYSLTFSA